MLQRTSGSAAGAVRAPALTRGVVDAKLCAIDDVWSGSTPVVPRTLC
jgi:hypothetical protein